MKKVNFGQPCGCSGGGGGDAGKNAGKPDNSLS
jgi:hypothetical protein